MIREKYKLVTEVHEGDRGDRAWLCQGTSARHLNTVIEIFLQETGDIINQGRRLM